MSCDVTFYHQIGCPKSQSIQLALEASHTPHKTVEINVNDKTYECNSKESQMLVLVKNGQTSALRNYLDAIVHLKLVAEDPVVRNKQEKVLNDFVTYILPYFEKAVVLQSPREGMDLFIETLSVLENQLVFSGGRFFGGNQPSVVDYGLFPYFEKVGRWTDNLEAKECPRLQAWIKAMQEHPLVTRIMQNPDDYKVLENFTASLSYKNLTS